MSLLLYIFGLQNKRIKACEDICRRCPINGMAAIIAEIRTDLKWIKEKLDKI